MSYFPRFSIPCEERGKKWNSSRGNKENSRNFPNLLSIKIIKKVQRNVTQFFPKESNISGTQFLTLKQYFIITDMKFKQKIYFSTDFFLIFP